MSSSVEQIKERLGIVDVVGSYIKLEKAGSNYRARCPFHNEKTPSFFVSPSRESYHCFGCNKGGDILSFVQEIEGLDFMGALEVLATRAGVELKAIDPKQRSEHERLYNILEAATEFFEARLGEHPAVKEYLLKRGLSEETIKSFRLGFAPDGWRNLHEHLMGRGYTEGEMEKAGLVVQSSSSAPSRGSRLYDRFRARIMFPLGNSVGKIVGFSGRILSGDDQAKYVNSPQTALYDKSNILYGFDRAKVEIKRQDVTILVEGQMDLLMAHQAGTTNAVAVSGTALTDKHLTTLRRLSNNLIMAFDGDLAGIAASRRAIDLALGLGMEVRIAELPVGEDPADVIAKDPKTWYAAVTEAKHVIDFYLSVLAKRGYDSRTLKLAVAKEVLPYVARLGNAIDQAHFVAKIATLLEIKEDPIWIELRKASPQATSRPEVKPEAPPKPKRRDLLLARLGSIVVWQESLAEPLEDPKALALRIEQIVGSPRWQTLYSSLHQDKDRIILEAEIAYEGMSGLEKEIVELITFLHEEELKDQLAELSTLMRQAEAIGNYDLLNEHLKKFQEISKLITSIKNT